MRYRFCSFFIGICFISFDLIGQCFPNQHSTNWFDGWYACEMKTNPNPSRSASHWLMIDLGENYRLQGSHWWNFNYPDQLSSGIKSADIDYSVDGVNWSYLKTVSLPQATGLPNYEGIVGPDLEDVEARYVLVTVKETYGNICAGLAEISIEGIKSGSTTPVANVTNEWCLQTKISPNPVVANTMVSLEGICEDKVHWILTDGLGRTLRKSNAQLAPPFQFDLDLSDLPAGVYNLSFFNGITSSQEKIIKIQ
ncbi:MAG: discoidin domain-containing protein [Saprospiraceae bacterium]|jgi:hypothetical protein